MADRRKVEKLIRIIKKREQAVDAVPAAFIRELEKAQNALLDEIIDFLKSVKTAGGNIENIPANVQMATRLRDQMRTWLRRAGYYSAVTSLGKEYKELTSLSRDFYKAADLPSVFTNRDLNALSKLRQADVDFLLNNDKRIINLTYSEFLSSVYKNRSFRDLSGRMERMHLGHTKKDKHLSGLLKRFSGTYAATAFASFDRQLQQIKSAELGIERYLYSGSLIKDSRDFCVQRAGRIFKKKEIERWSGLSWKGKVEGCDIFICLGGYNCQHILSPISDEFDLSEFEEIWNEVR